MMGNKELIELRLLTTLPSQTFTVGGDDTAMAYTGVELLNREGDKYYTHTVVHAEVFQPNPIYVGHADQSGIQMETYSIQDTIPFASAFPPVGFENTPPFPDMETVMFMETRARQEQPFGAGFQVLDQTQRFPEDAMYTSPTLRTVSRFIYPTVSFAFTHAVMESVTTPALPALFYLVLEREEIDAVEWLMMDRIHRFNQFYDYNYTTGLIQEATVSSEFPSNALGHGRAERMATYNSLITEEAETMLSNATMLNNQRDRQTMTTQTLPTGATLPQSIFMVAGITNSFRTNPVPIRYDATTNIKLML